MRYLFVNILHRYFVTTVIIVTNNAIIAVTFVVIIVTNNAIIAVMFVVIIVTNNAIIAVTFVVIIVICSFCKQQTKQ